MQMQEKSGKTYTKSVGREIRKTRESQNMTREQLVSRMETPCSGVLLRQYENGEAVMDIEVFFDLTKALCVTPNDLTPGSVMERAASALGDYARLNRRNKSVADEMINAFLKSQREEE